MIKTVILVGIFAIAPFVARAATCDAGYYLSDGECMGCNPNLQPYYCPGNDKRYLCPKTDTDYNQFGYTIISGEEGTWAGRGATDPQSCRADIYFRDEYGGEFLLEETFNGANYWGDRHLWYLAGIGHYLSSYDYTTREAWYTDVKPCTNAPNNAHYTGPGTPDAPDDSIIDANDCPWECDAGYGLHDGSCVPLCATDMRYIKTGNGLQFNLYPVRYSSPALYVKRNDTTCHAVLAPGAAKDAININHNGQIYHTVD